MRSFRGLSKNWKAYGALVLLWGTLPTLSFAQANIKPKWSTAPSQLEPNSSYFSSVQKDSAPTIADELLDSARVLELQQEYQNLNRDYEMKQNYSLTDRNDESAQNARLADFSKAVVGSVRDNQNKKNAEKMRGAFNRSEGAAKKPLTYAVAAAAVSTGQPVDAELGKETSVRASTNVPYETAYVQLFSPWGEGSFSTVVDPNAGNKMILPPPSWISREERYQFSFSRGIPLLGLGSGLTYGSTSNTVSASVSKPLNKNLTASFSTIHPVDTDTSRIKGPEETVRLNYELHF